VKTLSIEAEVVNERLLIKNEACSELYLVNTQGQIVKRIGADSDVNMRFKYKGTYIIRGCKNDECVDVEVVG